MSPTDQLSYEDAVAMLPPGDVLRVYRLEPDWRQPRQPRLVKETRSRAEILSALDKGSSSISEPMAQRCGYALEITTLDGPLWVQTS